MSSKIKGVDYSFVFSNRLGEFCESGVVLGSLICICLTTQIFPRRWDAGFVTAWQAVTWYEGQRGGLPDAKFLNTAVPYVGKALAMQKQITWSGDRDIVKL